MCLIQRARLMEPCSSSSYLKLAATSVMICSRFLVGFQLSADLAFVISGTRRCISSKPAG